MGLDSINLRASMLLPDKELEQANTSRDGNANERKGLSEKMQQNFAVIKFCRFLTYCTNEISELLIEMEIN
jgi:hypothetical protein